MGSSPPCPSTGSCPSWPASPLCSSNSPSSPRCSALFEPQNEGIPEGSSQKRTIRGGKLRRIERETGGCQRRASGRDHLVDEGNGRPHPRAAPQVLMVE